MEDKQGAHSGVGVSDNECAAGNQTQLVSFKSKFSISYMFHLLMVETRIDQFV